MDDPSADSDIVQDILGEETGIAWRWTNQRPRIKFWVDTLEGWKLYVKFRLPEVILQQTGPMTMALLVNGQKLGRKTFQAEGEYEYSEAVPAAALKLHEANIAGFDLDRVYISKRDGVKLGVLLKEIGFIKTHAR